MTSGENAQRASQDFLDANQYSLKSILKYERIFGHTWVSTGGELTTKEFCLSMNFRPGQKMLDIGCGTGGSAFFLARHYGIKVYGVDLSSNMISIAENRLKNEEKTIKDRVQFEIGDIFKVDFPENEFDVIYSRDTVLHIKDKESLFRRILPWLKPGGKLLVTDYCRGDREQYSQQFLDYVKSRDYDLRTVKQYGKILEDAGFKNVEAIDKSQMFADILKSELKYFTPTREAFIQDFCEADYKDIFEGWTSKVKRVEAGDQAWGLFIATK